jgi:hypothetical protein
VTTEAAIGGVSLAKYAAVNAAMKEGFALAEVLTVEGLDEPAWKEADAGLKVKLTREPAALSSYMEELAAAEDWLSRRVTPLEDHPEAWVAFLHAVGTSADSLALFEGNGLGVNDLSRLRRRWARRIEEDPALEKKLAKLADAPRALPRIEVEPAVLRPSRAAEAARAATSGEELPISSVGRRRALKAHREVLRALAARHAEAEPEEPRQVFAPVVAPGPSAIPPGMRGFLDVHGTQLAPEAPPTAPVLPFDPNATPTLPAPGEAPERVPKGMRGFVNVGGTQAAPAVPPGPALPFVKEPPSNAGALPPGMRGFLDVHGTQLAPAAPPAAPVLPFEPAGDARPPAGSVAVVVSAKPIAAGSVIPEGMRRFTNLTGTDAASDAPEGPALPFAAAPKARPAIIEVGAPESQPEPPTLPRPARAEIPLEPPQEASIPKGMRHFKSVSGTEISPEGAPKDPALPFAPAAADAPAPKAGAPPPLPSPAPRLTLEQYAQMSVELALYPAHKLTILQRYGVDDEMQRRLDGYWGARVREDAGIKAAWDRHYAEHWTRLRGPQGGTR